MPTRTRVRRNQPGTIPDQPKLNVFAKLGVTLPKCVYDPATSKIKDPLFVQTENLVLQVPKYAFGDTYDDLPAASMVDNYIPAECQHIYVTIGQNQRRGNDEINNIYSRCTLCNRVKLE
ncbi:LEF-5 [Crangon crangon nudivirus]|uniref:LEF-5 n=1 Tax=Crangon crangon nudivirus TaxID=2880838 RepID=A0AAE9BZR1_9VIRU|nr:LEF-5 [Crangon crangon nudivirus]UBZ25537.1 LEF-5 [Crangon crangon nudivirus]